MAPSHPGGNSQQWTFLTNHAHVLLAIVRSPTILIRDLATQVGITERGVQRIIADLQESGYLTTERQGRRNRYSVRTDMALRHPLERHRSLASLIDLLLDSPSPPPHRLPVSSARRTPPRPAAAGLGANAHPSADRGHEGSERVDAASTLDPYVRSNFE